MKIFSFDYKRLSILIGLLMGVFLLNFILSDKDHNIRYDDFALDKNTQTSRASVENKTIHCSDLKDLDLCIKGYEADGQKKSVIIWLGNSQLHAINQYQLGDETAASQIYRALNEYGYHTITLSQANANLQEHYLLFAYLLDKFPIKTLVLPIVFDDMREDEIRPNIKNILKDKSFHKKIDKTLTGKNLISKFIDKDLAGNNIAVLQNTNQNNLENIVDEKLGKIWPMWSNRDVLRNKLFGNLYVLRNYILGIKATTTRKMIKGRYIKNKIAYQDILNLAVENEVEVVTYITPIRNDIKIPYKISEYKTFKKEIEDIAKNYKIYFTSLENLVPSEFWGTKASTSLKEEGEVDFMHFQAEGHRLLAEAIFLSISKILQLTKKP